MEMAEMAEMAEEMGRNSRTLPHEIVFDILTRLPVKSLSRFRCVSKLWNSTISDRRFVKSHQSHCAFSRSVSDDGTTLLFTYPKDSNASRSLYIIVDDDDNNNNNREIKGPVREAVHQLTLPVSYSNLYVLDNLNGLICLAKDEVIKICNPSTHEFITLPTIEPEASLSPRLPVIWDANWFGYDPINNQYKLLCTWVFVTADRRLMEHRIFVLGEEEQSSWRRIGDGGLPHCPDSGNGVCVNGIIYYTAWAIDANLVDCEVLVAFDVRLETFKFVELPYGLASAGLEYFDLIRFDGHLVMFDYNCPQLGKTMEIWVLEDSVKPSWIQKSIVFSTDWTDIREDLECYRAGTTDTGEIIMAPRSSSKPFCLFYLNLKDGSMRRVQVCGLPDFDSRVGKYSYILATDYLENILSLSNLKY